MSKITDSAKGKPCDARLPFICNNNPETTVHCHLPDGSGTGRMGSKSNDLCGVRGCSSCHDVIDGRVKQTHYTRDEVLLMAYEGQQRTLRKLQHEGLICL